MELTYSFSGVVTAMFHDTNLKQGMVYARIMRDQHACEGDHPAGEAYRGLLVVVNADAFRVNDRITIAMTTTDTHRVM